jgi:hypothetical protein
LKRFDAHLFSQLGGDFFCFTIEKLRCLVKVKAVGYVPLALFELIH